MSKQWRQANTEAMLYDTTVRLGAENNNLKKRLIKADQDNRRLQNVLQTMLDILNATEKNIGLARDEIRKQSSKGGK